MEFSAELLAKAYEARNGELAWARGDIGAAIEAVVAGREAILGGEAWVVPGANTIVGVIGNHNCEHAVYHWSVPDRQGDEPWPDFVRRSATIAVRAIDQLAVEGEVRPDLAAFVRYNLTYVTEAEYGALSPEASPMTIRYALNRTEIVRAFLYGL